MLQVLVGSNNPTGGTSEMGTPELSIRREGSEIRVSVLLGPDSSANAETERAWLSRMATRYGGRLELEGATESILLPADGATDQREVEDLRRELEAAQRQGEAYARELAAVVSYSQSPPPRFSSQPADANKTLNALAAMAGGMSTQLRSLFTSIGRGISSSTGNQGSGPNGSDWLAEPMDIANEIVTDLVRLAECPIYESTQHLNFADTVRAAMAELESRAIRRGVALKSHIPGHADLESCPAAVALLARTLIHDAIVATPRGGQVTVSVESKEKHLHLLVTDGGPPIPEPSHLALAASRADPSSVGRPSTIALSIAHALAQHLGAQIDLAPPLGEGEAPSGRLQVRFGPAPPVSKSTT